MGHGSRRPRRGFLSGVRRILAEKKEQKKGFRVKEEKAALCETVSVPVQGKLVRGVFFTPSTMLLPSPFKIASRRVSGENSLPRKDKASGGCVELGGEKTRLHAAQRKTLLRFVSKGWASRDRLRGGRARKRGLRKEEKKRHHGLQSRAAITKARRRSPSRKGEKT